MRSKVSIVYFCIIYFKSNNRIIVDEDKSRFCDVHTFLSSIFLSLLLSVHQAILSLFIPSINILA